MRDSSLELRPGERFLDFQIVRVLGHGGVGVVYEVSYRGKRQALKLIRSEWVNDPAMVPRMINEGQILMRLNHPYIVAVHDAGMTPDNGVWIRMELLEGPNLREMMRRSGPVSLPRACAFLRTAAHAAHQCHVFGLIHRDIKPENFMVVRDEDGDDVLKLLDFGLAKLYGADTHDLRLIGTPQYMAPEQWNKEMPVTPATDLYAIATMIYELYVGHHPLFPDGKADNPWRMMKAHHETSPPPLEAYGMPAEIAGLIMAALRKDPARRPQDALRWAEDVWRAWRVVRDSHPEIDTYPGEPPLAGIRSRPLLVTGPSTASPWVGSSRTAPMGHVPTLRMRATPQGLARPSPVTSSANAGPSAARAGRTVKLPDAQRDPSCVAAEPSRSSAGGETAPLGEGSTGTVPISLSLVGLAPALPFRPSVPPGPHPPAAQAAGTPAPFPTPVQRGDAAAMLGRAPAAATAVAETAPLDGATSGVRAVKPSSEPGNVATEPPPVSGDLDRASIPASARVELALHRGEVLPAPVPAADTSTAAPRREELRLAPIPAKPWHRTKKWTSSGGRTAPASAARGHAGRGIVLRGLAVLAAVGALFAAWTLGQRSRGPSPSAAPSSEAVPSAAGAAPGKAAPLPTGAATEAPSSSAVPGAAPPAATSGSTPAAPSPSSQVPVASAWPAARPAPASRPSSGAPAASSPASSSPSSATTSPLPAVRSSPGGGRPRLPVNPGSSPAPAPSAAGTAKKPRLPSNPNPKRPAGPAPDLPGGPVLD